MTTLADQVRSTLVEEWDRTGATDADVAVLIRLIQSSATEDAIIDYLYDREREIMCFPGLGKQRLRRIARKLLATTSS